MVTRVLIQVLAIRHRFTPQTFSRAHVQSLARQMKRQIRTAKCDKVGSSFGVEKYKKSRINGAAAGGGLAMRPVRHALTGGGST